MSNLQTPLNQRLDAKETERANARYEHPEPVNIEIGDSVLCEGIRREVMDKKYFPAVQYMFSDGSWHYRWEFSDVRKAKRKAA